jgi:hypothetical protein
MKVMTVKEVLDLPDDSPVPCCKVQIKEVKQFYNGTNANGPWSLQKVNCMDATGRISLQLQNRAELTPDWANVWVYVEAGQDEKGKLVGAWRGKDEYRGRTTECIKIKDTGHITAAAERDGQQQTQSPEAQAARNVQAPPGKPVDQQRPPQRPSSSHTKPASAPTQGQSSPTKAPEPGSEDDQKKAIEKMRCYLGKHANGMILALDAAIYVARSVEAKHSEMQFSCEDIRSMAISLAIGADRQYLFDGLPTGPMTK